MAARHEKYSPRKWSFRTAISLYGHIVINSGNEFFNDFLDLMKTEKLNSKYRREPRALNNHPHRYCFLTVSRVKSKSGNWRYARRSGRRVFKDGYGSKILC